MGLLSFFIKIFNLKRSWKGTPEMFLAMVMEIQSRNNPVFSEREVMQWGEVMQKVIRVNLSPYKDFADLLANGKPDLSIVETVRGKLDEMNRRVELKRAIYGNNVDLGDDDVMKSDSESAVYARKLVKDLAKHVEFPDDEKKIIDKL